MQESAWLTVNALFEAFFTSSLFCHIFFYKTPSAVRVLRTRIKSPNSINSLSLPELPKKSTLHTKLTDPGTVAKPSPRKECVEQLARGKRCPSLASLGRDAFANVTVCLSPRSPGGCCWCWTSKPRHVIKFMQMRRPTPVRSSSAK